VGVDSREVHAEPVSDCRHSPTAGGMKERLLPRVTYTCRSTSAAMRMDTGILPPTSSSRSPYGTLRSIRGRTTPSSATSQPPGRFDCSPALRPGVQPAALACRKTAINRGPQRLQPALHRRRSDHAFPLTIQCRTRLSRAVSDRPKLDQYQLSTSAILLRIAPARRAQAGRGCAFHPWGFTRGARRGRVSLLGGLAQPCGECEKTLRRRWVMITPDDDPSTGCCAHRCK
jgi:hypothetical protein